ncbi:DUF302 domain-containing protein [Sulfurimonas sp.]|jgi:uncharacterized protein (DUF302 family)|uniref:DUF302 domain-containing protein n=1 Tax=Sulfurimonas sp. TaxID=2022749 RepID=UPI0025D9E8F9|nr:DUF302 domain-containing protein [Sulfurimonas sp.]MCK9473241.1 DUF302 domain-containing protein [Sulfurimonas sp.]
MKKIVIFIVALVTASVVWAQGDLHIFDVDNKNGLITTEHIEEAFVKNGFGIGVNSNMIKPFMIQFKETEYKVFTLLTVYHEKLSFELLKKYPEAGVFLPMGVGIYQNKKEDTLHVSVLTSEAQEKILGFSDAMIKEIEKEVLNVLNKALTGEKHRLSEDSLQESRDLVTKYELELEGEDVKVARENVILGLENGLSLYGFIVPSKLDVSGHLDGSVYDFYQTYSICKLPVIYTVSLTRPEAAAFAPCSLAIYKKKDEDKIVLAFPAVYNWLSSARVEDKDAKEVLLKAQEQFEAILTEIVE